MNNIELQSKIKELKLYIKENLKDYPNFIGANVHNITHDEEDSLLVIQGKNKQVQGFYMGKLLSFMNHN